MFISNSIKKGFTLSELLAVILIISIISLVSIMGITKVINNSRESMYNTQIKSIENSLKLWGAENIEVLPQTGKCIYMTLDDLITLGYIDDNIIDARDNSALSGEMKLKISSTTKAKSNRIVTNYYVDVANVDDCNYLYGDFTLLNGEEFNRKIKRHMNNRDTILDTKLKSIIFLNAGQIPTGINEETFKAYDSIDLSINNDESVMGYFSGNILYVYSDGILYANTISDRMFYGMTALESIDFSGLDTRNVISMTSMFDHCSSLSFLNLTSFDTSNVLKMDNMFRDCKKLSKLDISTFKLLKVYGTNGLHQGMFSGCENLYITVSSEIKTNIEAQLLQDNVEVNLTIK